MPQKRTKRNGLVSMVQFQQSNYFVYINFEDGCD